MKADKVTDLFLNTMLYDFYGDLLTAHQQEVYEAVVFNDCSLSEAAEQFSVTRQGISDLIKRCNKQLSDYEKKLGLVRKYEKAKEQLDQIHQVVLDYEAEYGKNVRVSKIDQLVDEIRENF